MAFLLPLCRCSQAVAEAALEDADEKDIQQDGRLAKSGEANWPFKWEQEEVCLRNNGHRVKECLAQPCCLILTLISG